MFEPHRACLAGAAACPLLLRTQVDRLRRPGYTQASPQAAQNSGAFVNIWLIRQKCELRRSRNEIGEGEDRRQSIFRRSGNRFAAENATTQGQPERIPIPLERNSL
jgi:hypothetical protein